MALYRGQPVGGGGKPGECWSRAAIAAATFASAADPGELLRATLRLGGLDVRHCQGPIPGVKHRSGGAAWAADDPAFKARYLAARVDVLVYQDAPQQTLRWDQVRGQVAPAGSFGMGVVRVHVPNMLCWRIISARGRAALTVRNTAPASVEALTLIVERWDRAGRPWDAPLLPSGAG